MPDSEMSCDVMHHILSMTVRQRVDVLGNISARLIVCLAEQEEICR